MTGLDAQGDKITPRLVYGKSGGHESIVAVHSVNTSPGGGWCALVRVPDRQKPQYYPVSAGDLFLLAVRGPREGEQIVGKRRRFVGNEEIAFAYEQK